MAVKFPQFDNELLGGSDTWNNDLAGQILLQDYFEPAPATTAYVISANTTGPYAATSGLTNSEATFINESLPQQNYGEDAVGLIAFSAGGNRQRGLFRFADLANVPDGTVTNAQFGFYSEFGNFTPTRLLEICPLKRNYNQTQVTWEVFSTGNTWQQFGADGPSDKGSVLDSQNVAGTNLAVFSGAALDAWVQACIDGTDTFQTLLVQFFDDDFGSNTLINFWTHLGAVDGERPFLTFDLASNNTNYTDAVTENIGVADSSTQLSTYALNVTENISLADIISAGNSNFTNAVTENISLADISTQSYAYTSNITENISLADIISAGNSNFTNAVTENINVADSSTQVYAYTSNVTENINVADTNTITVQFVVTRTEPITLADTPAVTLQFTLNITENIFLADIQDAGGTNFIDSLTENISVADTLAVTLQFDLSRIEDISLTDSSSAAKQLLFNIVEGVSNTDILAVQTQYSIAVNENFTVLDSTAISGWVTIVDSNGVVWSLINDAQTDSWTDVVDTQNPNWIIINDNQ
jgi:hypothetical protein